MRTSLITLLLIAMSSCTTLGPDYQRPRIETPPSWRVELPVGKQLVDSIWWDEFNDPVLTQLIHEVLEKNRDLRLATARVDQFLGVLTTTRSQFFPQTGYGLEINRQDSATTPSSPADTKAFTTYQGAFNVNWELDIWGRIRRADEAARAQVFASEEGRRGVLLSIVTNFATGYIHLRGLDRQLEIARETERAYADKLRIFQLRHQYGTISRVELRQVQYQYEGAVQIIPQLQALLTQQENLLSLLLGRNPGTIPRGKSIDELVVPPLPNELPLTLIERRPDIRQAEYELIAANARIGEAKALYFPTVSLAGLLGRQSYDISDLFKGGAGFWSLGGSIAGPLISFGAISGQVDQAEAIASQSVLRYEQTIQGAYREVEDALVGSLKTQEQLRAQQRQVDILDDYARLSRLKFENGNIGYLQVLDAERELFSVQLERVKTQAALFAFTIDIYRTMAGGWIDNPIPE